MSIYQLLGMKPLPGGGSSHPLTRSHVYSG
jgi:hypothetical protein